MRMLFFSIPILSPAFVCAATVDFVRDIQPIFAEHCMSCHGPDGQKSDYRLDVREIALRGGESGVPAITPKRPASSHLLQLVDGSNPELFMPPRKSDARPLSESQIRLLSQWILEGAEWPDEASAVISHSGSAASDHWAFRPLERPSVPGHDPNPIDAFIRARLAEHELDLAPAADPQTLSRRLHFDLIGLPPDPLAPLAGTEEAYLRLVDQLLASPQHGERWARHWLDVVHFGETHGYDKDKPRLTAWPYRDYVIRSFNQDKPYSRFIQEQIAGDVLFPGTADGITALGFIAAGPWDFIGHFEVPETKIDGKIARHLDRDDMISNTIGTFQSVTVHCAQCHDHKFDPISQRDYFSLQAIFAALDRTELDYYPDDADMQRYADLQRYRRQLEDRITAITEPLIRLVKKEYDAISKRMESADSQGGNPNSQPDFGYHSQISPVQDAIKWVQIDLGSSQPITRVRLRPCYDDHNQIGAGFGFPVRFKVEVSDDPAFQSGVSLIWREHDRSFMNDFPNPGLTAFETGTAKDDGAVGRYLRITATKLAARSQDFIFALAEVEAYSGDNPQNLAAGRPVSALDSIERAPRWRRQNLTDGIFPSPKNSLDRQQLLREREELVLSKASAKDQQELQQAKQELAALPKPPPPQKVYGGGIHTGSRNFIGTGAMGGKPRPIRLLRRGDVTQPQDEVRPGALEAIAARFSAPFESPAADAAEGERRAALALWLSHTDNALTWRSIVNRVWQYHFGRGLVETPNDFGIMGAAPSHPELLEWLAVWFRDEAGGSLKALHRLIVSSRTYRQSSTPDPAVVARASQFDAGNALLWKQNRRRLEAEAIRDRILHTAGKLDLSMGGPSFQDFVIEKPQHSPHYQYHLADPNDPALHRRAIYRFIVRSQQQPWMAALDCADPSMLVDRRNETITPLQALAQLNNQLSVAMAKAFAQRVRAATIDPVEQIRSAFLLALQRAPTAEEEVPLVEHLKQHGLEHCCRLIMNLNEFVFVD